MTALQAVIVWVLAPRVMSSAIGLHPLLVFVGILAGAKLAGLWGAVFGVPAVHEDDQDQDPFELTGC